MTENKRIYFVIAIAVLLAVVGIYTFSYYRNKGSSANNSSEQLIESPSASMACDADAMQCPDGTVVGRVGPTCDFAPCSNASVREQMQLQGTYVCLAHKNTSGAQTDECQGGIKTDEGKYYSLDFGPLSQPRPELVIGDQFRAQGMLTPIEMLSSNFLRDNYTVDGVFLVTDSMIKL